MSIVMQIVGIVIKESIYLQTIFRILLYYISAVFFIDAVRPCTLFLV